MPDDFSTTPQGDSTGKFEPDPLGIKGWIIADKYKIDSYLGGGGFGEVYNAHNVNLVEQRLVIKFFKRVQAREKFDKEAKILCMLDHPNISRVIDYLPDEGAVVVAFIDGIDGSRMLKQSGALRPDLFLKVARAMTSAIAYAHEKKIAHRDIKPGNILIDKNEQVYLIDFGIAKEMGTDATRTGYQALTPMIAAPERQSGEQDYNPFLSDIYEMGITLYNFVTNSLPYRNPANPNVTDWGGVKAEELSPELRRILMRATHPDPAQRYRTAAEMANDFKKLEKVLATPRKKPVRLIIAVLAIIVIAAALATMQFWLPGQSDRSDTPTKPAVQPNQPVESAAQPADSIPRQAQSAADREESETKAITPVPVQDKSTKKQTEAEPTQVVQEEKKVEPPPVKKTPPPVTDSKVMIRVKPDRDVTLWIDDKEYTPNHVAIIKPGSHQVAVMHPDYPLVYRRVTIAESRDQINIDLPQIFWDVKPLTMQVALYPPSDDHILDITINGKTESFSEFPVLEFKRLPGNWQMEMVMRDKPGITAGEARVDSCVVFPYGGGPRYAISGSRGLLELSTSGDMDLSTYPLVVYWSEK